MKLILIALLSVACLSAQSQNSDSPAVKRYYEQNTILWPGGNFYYKGDVRYPFRHLRRELKLSGEALLEFKEYQKANRRMIISAIILEVCAISLITTENPTAQILLIAGAGTSTAFAIGYSKSSFAHLQRSIWVYNRDVLLQ